MMSKSPKPQQPANQENPANREEMPGAARSMDKKDPPPHTRNAPQTQNAERKTPRSKR